jgi:hypothetical protein
MSAKTVNEKDTMFKFDEMSAKFMGDSKAAVDTMINVSNQVTAETQTVLTYQQEMLKKSLDMWQGNAQSYADLMIQASQRVLDQSLDLRGRVDQVATDGFKKNQGLVTQERQVMLEAAEMYQVQAQAAGEYAAKFLTTASKVMTSTALFSDWAAERVAKMFTSMSAN